jgi:hypothetical protein
VAVAVARLERLLAGSRVFAGIAPGGLEGSAPLSPGEVLLLPLDPLRFRLR